MKLQIQCAWGALLRGALIGLALALVSACSTTPAYPPAPATLAGVDYNYHIGVSDTVNVIVWRNPELSMSVPVRPDGKITTPLIDDLPRGARRRPSSRATSKRRSSNTFAIPSSR